MRKSGLGFEPFEKRRMALRNSFSSGVLARCSTSVWYLVPRAVDFFTSSSNAAGTLEWATASPPPAYNFALIPVCSDREPLWQGEEPAVVGGLRVDRREFITTSLVEAEPEMREASPPPSIWPFISALIVSVTLLGSIFTPWAVVWGLAPTAVAITLWFWPKGSKEEES